MYFNKIAKSQKQQKKIIDRIEMIGFTFKQEIEQQVYIKINLNITQPYYHNFYLVVNIYYFQYLATKQYPHDLIQMKVSGI